MNNSIVVANTNSEFRRPSFMTTLPLSKKTKQTTAPIVHDQCGICLDDINGSTKEVVHTRCGHKFCYGCFVSHGLHSPNATACPNCRGNIEHPPMNLENKLRSVESERDAIATDYAVLGGSLREIYFMLNQQIATFHDRGIITADNDPFEEVMNMFASTFYDPDNEFGYDQDDDNDDIPHRRRINRLEDDEDDNDHGHDVEDDDDDDEDTIENHEDQTHTQNDTAVPIVVNERTDFNSHDSGEPSVNISELWEGVDIDSMIIDTFRNEINEQERPLLVTQALQHSRGEINYDEALSNYVLQARIPSRRLATCENDAEHLLNLVSQGKLYLELLAITKEMGHGYDFLWSIIFREALERKHSQLFPINLSRVFDEELELEDISMDSIGSN